MQAIKCDHCDELIAEDELILVIDGDDGRWTTLAAERVSSSTEVFHRICFHRVRESGTIEWLRGV